MPPSSNLMKLGPQVFISEPPPSEGRGSSSDADARRSATKSPGLIILFGWLDGKLVHVAKYSDIMRRLFPTSIILVVLVDSTFFWLTDATKEAALAPVMTIFLREKQTGNLEKGILLHVMSNGGSFQLLVFQKMLMQAPLGAAFQPPIALCLDSTPGDNALESAINSNKPNSLLLQAVVTPLIVLLYGVNYCFFHRLVGKQSVIDDIRVAALEPAVLPLSANNSTKAAPRLYIYSETDQIMRPDGIKRHAEQAIAAGLDVQVERYERSPHVSHARTDPERYWTAVQSLWLRAMGNRDPQVKL